MEPLQQARERIDRIDAELARLFAARMEAAKEIAAWKREKGLPFGTRSGKRRSWRGTWNKSRTRRCVPITERFKRA